jgi:valyl-tRNA synthetase
LANALSSRCSLSSRTATCRFDFGEAGRLLYEFVWSDFADWYIEAAKARLYGEDAAAAEQVRRSIGRKAWQRQKRGCS